MTDEKTPLMSAEATLEQSATRPPIESVTPTVDDAHSTVNCQVCKQVITFQIRDKQMVVRCPHCSEATPIKGPPAGKQFVRCPCNCLLVCNATTTKVGCPRPDCQKVIVLSESDSGSMPRVVNMQGGHGIGPGASGGTFGTPHSLRLACGNCNSPFSIYVSEPYGESRPNAFVSFFTGGRSSRRHCLIAARCPQCRKVTSVGPAYARVRWIMYGILTIIAAIVAISVTSGTVYAAKEKKALYFLWSVLYVITLILGLRALVFILMPVSSVEVPTLQI